MNFKSSAVLIALSAPLAVGFSLPSPALAHSNISPFKVDELAFLYEDEPILSQGYSDSSRQNILDSSGKVEIAQIDPRVYNQPYYYNQPNLWSSDPWFNGGNTPGITLDPRVYNPPQPPLLPTFVPPSQPPLPPFAQPSIQAPSSGSSGGSWSDYIPLVGKIFSLFK